MKGKEGNIKGGVQWRGERESGKGRGNRWSEGEEEIEREGGRWRGRKEKG